MAVKDATEVGGGAVGGLCERGCWGLRGFEFERGNGAVGDAAGDDPVEVAKIWGYVEREPVRGYGLGDVNTDGGKLPFGDGTAGVGPDTGAFGDALGGDAEVFTGEDEGFFHEADEVDRAEVGAMFAGEVAAEVEDGVADELAGAVVGDVSAAVNLVDFDAFGGEGFVGEQDIGSGGIAAEGEDRRVFQQDKGVTNLVRFSGGYDFGLDAQAFSVGDAAKLEQVDVHGVALLEAEFGEARVVIGTTALRPMEEPLSF